MLVVQYSWCSLHFVVYRFVAYLDDAAPSEAEVIVWSENLTNDEEVQCCMQLAR